MKPLLSLISYNPIEPYQKGIVHINNCPVLFLPETFTPKGRGNVYFEDPNLQLAISFSNSLEKNIIFLGKKDSGSLEIIDVTVQAFKQNLGSLFYVLCDCDLKEKTDLLAARKISPLQYMMFGDSHPRCYETPILLGHMFDYINKRKHG